MPDQKPPSTPTRIDKPLLRLASTGNKAAKRPSKTTGEPIGKPSGKPSGKPTDKPTRKPTGKPTGAAAATSPRTPTTKPTTRHGKLASRQIAYDILVAIEDGAQLDKALAANQDLPQLDERDRKFVRLLVSTSLRHRGQLEKVMAPMISRRPFGAQAHANLVLLLGAVQLLILKTGPHAAVDNTVELMRATGFERLCGLANAVMRRLTREGDARWQTTSHLHNLPDWLRQSWLHYWGETATAEIANLAMTPPPLDISVRTAPADWASKLEATLIEGSSLRRAFDGDPTQLPGFESGDWWVQDISAAMPARLLGVSPGQSVIDLCAAPGGKTAQLIAAGARVTAIDQNRKRLDRLRRNLKRLKMTADLRLADGRDFTPDTSVDAVLLDAPCSATGTIRRRPDILARRQPEDIAALQQIQWQLATTALGWLRPGGKFVYATCSLQPEEGEDVVSAIIDGAAGRFGIDPITTDEAGLFAGSIDGRGCLRILPGDYTKIGGADGFFIARLTCLG